MPAVIQFLLTDKPIDIPLLSAELHDPAAGAEVTFAGRVRNHNDGRSVCRLEYLAYPALALATGRRILEEEAEIHGILRAVAIHRTGTLDIGDSAVWLGVAAAHRTAAFDAARAIMERIKHELPVWKKEHYRDGPSAWIGPDNTPAETGVTAPEWSAGLGHIYVSPGNDFRGRHGSKRLEHGVAELSEVECVAGMGLRGDRYFGYKPDFKGQVTFFEAAVVEAVRARFGLPGLQPSAFRRNLIVDGVRLADWVGKTFRFQGVLFAASEECKPCSWMNEAVAEGCEDFLRGNCRGGLRARVLSDGILRARVSRG